MTFIINININYYNIQFYLFLLWMIMNDYEGLWMVNQADVCPTHNQVVVPVKKNKKTV